MAQEETRRRGWMRGLLVASLALNLAFIGAAGGFALRGGSHDGGRHGPGGPEAMPYLRALSEPQRDRMRSALRRDFRDRRATRGQLTEDYRAAIAALRAEPFDPAALADVLARQGARAQERLAAGQGVMVDFVTGMDPSDRAAYADRLSQETDRLAERWRRVARD